MGSGTWTFPDVLTWHQCHPSAVPLDPAQSPPQHPFPRVSWKGPKHCTTPGGTVIIKCDMCSIRHFPESRSEASRPFAKQQGFNGHLLGGRKEDERLSWNKAWVPLYVGCLSYHSGACFEARCWTHLCLFQVSGQLEHHLGPHLGHFVLAEAKSQSLFSLSDVCEVRTASFSDKHSAHFLGSQEA